MQLCIEMCFGQCPSTSAQSWISCRVTLHLSAVRANRSPSVGPVYFAHPTTETYSFKPGAPSSWDRHDRHLSTGPCPVHIYVTQARSVDQMLALEGAGPPTLVHRHGHRSTGREIPDVA